MIHKHIRSIALGLSTLAPLSLAQSSSAQTQSLGLADLLGKKTYGDIASPVDYTSKEGAKLQKGRSIAEGLPLQASGLGKLTPTSALQAVGADVDFSKVRLVDLEFINKVSLDSLVKADPTLRNILASSIGWAGQGEKTLGEIANNVELAKLPLPESVLKNNTVADFGNIANISYDKFPELVQLPISDIPGLSNVPIAKIVGAPSTGAANIRIVRVNKILTGQKDINAKVASGSDVELRAKWTKNEPVSGVELVDVLNPNKNNLANGAVAIIGATQMIRGGNVPPSTEPTGFKIPGTPFKISFETPDAKKGTVSLQLNMQLEYAFGLKTAHFIPIPTGITVSEKSKTALIPMEVPAPDLIAMGGITSPAPRALIASPVPTTTPSTTAITGSLFYRPETSEADKVKALGSAVKSSTDPITGKTL
jgi:hypothetical protein